MLNIEALIYCQITYIANKKKTPQCNPRDDIYKPINFLCDRNQIYNIIDKYEIYILLYIWKVSPLILFIVLIEFRNAIM